MVAKELNADVYFSDPETDTDPADNGGVEDGAHPAIEVVAVEAGVAAIAGVQRIHHSRKYPEQRYHEAEGKNVVDRTEPCTLLIILHTAPQHEISKVDQHTNGSAQLLGIIAPGLAPGIFGPLHAGNHAEDGKDNAHFCERGAVRIKLKAAGSEVMNAVEEGQEEEEDHRKPHGHVVVQIPDGLIENVLPRHIKKEPANERVGSNDDGCPFGVGLSK